MSTRGLQTPAYGVIVFLFVVLVAINVSVLYFTADHSGHHALTALLAPCPDGRTSGAAHQLNASNSRAQFDVSPGETIAAVGGSGGPLSTNAIPGGATPAVPAAFASAFDDLPEVRNVQVTPRRAIATFLQNDVYLAGALTLAYSLRKRGNALPLLLFTLKGKGVPTLSPASLDAARHAGWRIRTWAPIGPFKEPAPHFRYQCVAIPLVVAQRACNGNARAVTMRSCVCTHPHPFIAQHTRGSSVAVRGPCLATRHHAELGPRGTSGTTS
jgi:hypothetical protein